MALDSSMGNGRRVMASELRTDEGGAFLESGDAVALVVEFVLDALGSIHRRFPSTGGAGLFLTKSGSTLSLPICR